MSSRCDSPAFPFTQLVPALESVPSADFGYRSFNVNRDEIPISSSDLPKHFQKIRDVAVLGQAQRKADRFFEKLGIEIVSDNVGDLTPKQIKTSEATSYFLLYCGIKAGDSTIQIDGGYNFEKKSLDAIKALLSIPSGRYLLLSVSRNIEPVILVSSNYCHVDSSPTSRDIKVHLNLHEPIYTVSIDSRGKRKITLNSPQVLLAHELIHVLHTLQKRRMMFQQRRFGLTPELDRSIDSMVDFYNKRSPFVDYTNLSELFTISGIPGQGYVCEQMIRYELDENKRYGHICSKFPSFQFHGSYGRSSCCDRWHEPSAKCSFCWR